MRAKAKEFIANPYNDETKPEKISKNVPFFGTVQVTENHVVSLRCDRGSSYKAYMAVQNELVAAYNELRDELAQEKWQKNYVCEKKSCCQKTRRTWRLQENRGCPKHFRTD